MWIVFNRTIIFRQQLVLVSGFHQVIENYYKIFIIIIIIIIIIIMFFSFHS